MRYQVRAGDNPLGLNVVFCSPWMRDRVICLSQGVEVLSYKHTLREHALVYNRGPAGGERRVGVAQNDSGRWPTEALIRYHRLLYPSCSRRFTTVTVDKITVFNVDSLHLASARSGAVLIKPVL